MSAVLAAKVAAAHLGISLRLLREQTAAGRIPHVRIGGRILYPVAALDEFLRSEAANSLAAPAPPTLIDLAPRRRRRIVQPTPSRTTS